MSDESPEEISNDSPNNIADEAPSDLDLDTEEVQPEKKSKLKLIIIIVGVLVLASVSAGAYLYFGDSDLFANMFEPEDSDDMIDLSTLPPIYYALDKPFIVNFSGEHRSKFIQVDISVMSKQQEAIDAVKLHMPLLRNDLLILIGSKTYEELSTLAGKERLREDALKVIQAVLEEQHGDPGIESVLFTKFIMQ